MKRNMFKIYSNLAGNKIPNKFTLVICNLYIQLVLHTDMTPPHHMHPKNNPGSKVAIVLCPKWFKLLNANASFSY